MWSDDIRQIIGLFHSRLHFGEVIEDPIDYVDALKPELRAAGPELMFLQLAVPDRESPFGWKPTPRLIELIAERKNGKKSKRLYEAHIMWRLLHDYVFGYQNREGGSIFTRELLLAVGLLQKYDDYDWVTDNLHIQFDNGYYDKLIKDGVPLFYHRPIRMSARGHTLLRELESQSQ